MAESLRVHLLPSHVSPEELAGHAVVVIDVLRATTTIVHALAAGATSVLPCLEVEQALLLAQQFGPAVVLGGERGGRKIAGFDLGNSPEEYSPATVAGKRVIFTTTNGTKAMLRCRLARRVLIGAFVNFSAICERLRNEARVDLLCSGTDNQITREDVLFAGAVVEDLLEQGGGEQVTKCELNDQALIALDAWRAVRADMRQALSPLVDQLRSSRGGRNLLEIGQERDIDIAAQIDRLAVAPELDVATWVITASKA
ncbi:MAG TPA: 2-phosphosulfolactate phosphatase [Pirellulaceae bacterium]|nr:2-phosphosulfolactate phosphatase [Pirellulaceae bacterium]